MMMMTMIVIMMMVVMMVMVMVMMIIVMMVVVAILAPNGSHLWPSNFSMIMAMIVIMMMVVMMVSLASLTLGTDSLGARPPAVRPLARPMMTGAGSLETSS